MAVISLTDVIKLFGGIHKTFAAARLRCSVLWSAGFIASKQPSSNGDNEHFYGTKWFMFMMTLWACTLNNNNNASHE